MSNIQLVKAPCMETGMPENKWYTPMNLLWLGTYLQNKGHQVEILDGQHLSTQDISKRISSPFVGVSFDIMSSSSLDDIVEGAKKRNAKVIVGGQAATPLAQILIKKNPNIDFVVRYDGEEALRQIIEGVNPKEIPNITYRKGREVLQNPDLEVDLTSLPIPNRKLVNLNNYIDSFQRTKTEQNLPFSYNRPTNSYSKKGCPIRIRGHGCSWCSRVDRRFRQKTPQQFIDELTYLSREFGIDHVSEFADDFLGSKDDEWLRELEELVGSSKQNVSLRIYTSIRNVSEENLQRLKRVGVETVLLGIESGNDMILRQNGKYQTKEHVIKSCELLSKYNIRVSPAYILGLVGETEESLKDTIRLSEQVSEICKTEISYWNPLTPLPTSNVWNILMQRNEFRDKFGDTYKLDPVELQKEHLRYNTKLGVEGYERILEIREEMLSRATIPSREYVPEKRKTTPSFP